MAHLKCLSAVLGTLACGVALQVNAASDTFMTPSGASTGGQPVDASATFTTGAGTVSISLNNLFANPTSVVQNLSDLSFTLSNGATSGTLASSSGAEVTVNGDGTVSPGSTVPTGWVLTGSRSARLKEPTSSPGSQVRCQNPPRWGCSGWVLPALAWFAAGVARRRRSEQPAPPMRSVVSAAIQSKSHHLGAAVAAPSAYGDVTSA